MTFPKKRFSFLAEKPKQFQSIFLCLSSMRSTQIKKRNRKASLIMCECAPEPGSSQWNSLVACFMENLMRSTVIIAILNLLKCYIHQLAAAGGGAFNWKPKKLQIDSFFSDEFFIILSKREGFLVGFKTFKLTQKLSKLSETHRKSLRTQKTSPC